MDNRKFELNAAAAAPAAPVAPSNGYPSNGDPVANISPTEPGAFWFHQVGEELRAVIEGAGLAVSTGDLTQLKKAIQRMIDGGDYKQSCRFITTGNVALTGLGTQAGGDWGAALTAGDRILVVANANAAENGPYIAAAGAWTRTNDGLDGTVLTPGAIFPITEGTAFADTQWTLTTDGAITVGTTGLAFQMSSGSASTARKGMVQLATSAEAQALTDALKALTPATLAAAFQGGNRSAVVNGYQKLPGGLIIQWGATASSGTGANNTPVTFPIAFPNNCFIAIPASGSSGNANIQMGALSTTTAMFTAYIGLTITTGVNVSWIAIGF